MMQPYLFPYLGYFALIEATDRWVVFDTPQYIRRGWVNRNRVLSSGAAGWKHICVPVSKASRETPIRNIRIADRSSLSINITNSLTDYKHWGAPFYNETQELIRSCLSIDTNDLTQLLVHCLKCTCEHIDLVFDPCLYSNLNVESPGDPHPGDWARLTAIHMNASEYINPLGGRELFSLAAFEAAGIKLSILKHCLPEYPQGPHKFQQGLSIIDVLMWNGRSLTRKLVSNYELNSINATNPVLARSA